MLLCNCCGVRGCTQAVSAFQLMGGSLLCWRNFLLNLSPKLCCSLRKEVVVTTFPHEGFLLACPPCTSPIRSLPVFSGPLWVRRGTSSPPPSSLLSLSTNLPLWACVVGFSPLLITAALKATFFPPTTAATLCWDGQHSQLCKGVSPWEYSIPHHSLSEAFHPPAMSPHEPGSTTQQHARLLALLLARCTVGWGVSSTAHTSPWFHQVPAVFGVENKARAEPL